MNRHEQEKKELLIVAHVSSSNQVLPGNIALYIQILTANMWLQLIQMWMIYYRWQQKSVHALWLELRDKTCQHPSECKLADSMKCLIFSSRCRVRKDTCEPFVSLFFICVSAWTLPVYTLYSFESQFPPSIFRQKTLYVQENLHFESAEWKNNLGPFIFAPYLSGKGI